MFAIGDEVMVCGSRIAGLRVPPKNWPHPIRGVVYRVSGTFTFPNGRSGIDLAECPAPENGWWSAARFRKIRKNEAEARATWQEMLTNPQPVDA